VGLSGRHVQEKCREGGTTRMGTPGARVRQCRRSSEVRPRRPTLRVEAPKNRGCSGVRTAAREVEGLPAPWSGGWPIKTKGGCGPRPGQPGRSDPTHTGSNFLRYRLKERTDSRRQRITGTMPEFIRKSMDGANNSRQDDVRKGSAQETRGLGQATAASTVR